ncbi:phosphatidylinositol phosphate synthase [Corynebacterium pygosceleis]|uniref:Phosphatidylinositol phosphate synthase n=1 Tax=Corynebacterium pygosceleis TaxID=2800406 RepID=A0A9Q4C911_9CORY|nr:CDP-alcohol phosphatidyltransferase family protein [Corynebacterium pygosceleis]MCK7636917.1 CDP-alcohol phosphatidyltransferase family protein [Corynebacterium pygosceleis]MCK7674391.1 CDP-alcohol phosphatidyltransferase family protein [Corynebacterium pygosceleis]MCL0120311.1 CDP-alcohol phosphatidyltransferase family protein [Corynebacterium pygosceleis]MCX7467670.1 CDP-alcohol phosphatidyltransferase family protein [Corynebacterium pygosceleis]
MLSARGRRPAAVVVEPVARFMLRLGLSPNTITVVSASLTIALSVILIPTGHLFAAAVLTGVFAAFDMIDGTMARMRGGGTRYGATLDATCDRITDGALFGAITWWLIYTHHAGPPIVVAALIVLVGSQVISYVKARGEASGLRIVGGLIERPERLIIGLVGIGLTGLGVPGAVETALCVLAAGSLFTIVQRLRFAARSAGASETTAPPAGARSYRK